MKICRSCGCENADECRFCKECGTAFGEIAAETQDGVKKLSDYSFRPVPDEEIQALVHRKTPLAEKILCGVIALAIFLGIILMVFNVRGDQRQTAQIEMLCGKNKSIFLYNGERLDGSVGDDVEYCVTSADGSAAYAIGDDGKIYAISKNGVEKIGKDAESAVIAPKGNYIFYVDSDNDGFLYNVKKNKSEKVSSDVEILTAVFSPDGKTLVFNRLGGGMYLYDGGDCEKIDSGVACAAVSDRAKRLYAVSYLAEPDAPEKPNASDYEDYDAYKEAFDAYSELYEAYEKALEKYEEYLDREDISLYYYPAAKADKRTELTDELLYGAEFNGNVSQVIFRESDGRTYFCEKDSEPERISKESVFPCSYGDMSYYCGINAGEIIDRDSLLNMNYRSEDALWYVDKSGEAEKIDSGIASYTSFRLSDNGKKLCYVNEDGKLYLTDAKGGDSDRIAKDVNSFIAENSLKAFYVLDKDGDLYYIKKNGDKEKIDSDVYTICEAPSGGIYYITDDYDLYFAEKAESEKINGSGNVMKVESGERFAMYYTNDSKKGKSATYVSVKGDENFDESYKDYVPFDYAYYAY